MAHHCLGNAADQGARETATAMTANHNEIRRPLPGSFYDLRAGSPLWDELQGRDSGRKPRAEVRYQSRTVLLGAKGKLVSRDPGIRRKDHRRIDGVDKRYFGMKRTCQLYANMGCMRRDRITIYSNENFSKTHYDLPI